MITQMCFINLSCVPYIYYSIFRYRYEMGPMSLTWLPSIHINWWRNECNICDKLFMRSYYIRLTHISHFNYRLGFIIFFNSTFSEALIITTTSNFCFFLGICYSMISWCNVPNNNLSIQASSNQNIWIFRMKFNSCYFNRSF
jgi:hypothetical protein